MSHFWRGLFEHFKDCGRNAALFYVSLAGGLALLTVVACLLNSSVDSLMIYGLPVAFVSMAVWLAVSIRHAISRNRQRLNISPLSSDEISKARSRLVRSQR